jgi:hypothetical protein
VAQPVSANREAYLAIEPFRETGGFVALTELSAFDYLTLRRDPVTTRLVSDGIRHFVAGDLENGGTFIDTLREYVAADMNARVAADRLFIHINTVHYRLGRIARNRLRHAPAAGSRRAADCYQACSAGSCGAFHVRARGTTRAVARAPAVGWLDAIQVAERRALGCPRNPSRTAERVSASGPGGYANRLTNSSAVSATSRQPLSITSA